MPRKRSNLSQYSRGSKRLRAIRSQETNEDYASRLSSQRSRTAASRSLETSEERNTRLSADRERHTLTRASETFTDREFRLSSQRSRTAESRSLETSEERITRLSADRKRHTLARASETFTDRELRLSSQRSRTAESRSLETSEERNTRLSADRERHTLTRASETFTDRELRLSSQRSHTAASRSLQNNQERNSRLTADRVRHTLSRILENIEQRNARLSADRERHSLSYASQTFTQREEHLSNARDRQIIARTLESDHQHQQRLDLARESYEQMRQNRDNLLLRERERVNEIRQQETEEQHQERLESVRLRYFVNRMSHLSGDSYDSQRPWVEKEKSAFTYSPRIDYASFSFVGRMLLRCNYCEALKWQNETNGMCCASGKVHISLFDDPPDLLQALLNGEHPQSKHFLEKIRLYNNAFQMTSFGAKQITVGPFMPTFKVQGQVYHLIGSLLPENESKFIQIYFISDYQEQANIRNQNFPLLNNNLITLLQNLLHDINPYVHSFKSALESVPQGQINNYKFVISADKRPTTEHPGRYNAPIANEVAVVLVDQECERRDIVLRTRDERLQRIYETHRSYDALQYPLIYCHGEDGYNFGLHQVNPITRAPNFNKKISAQQFYAYLLQIRSNRFAYLQRFRGLFNQFIVDMYAKIETERLVYIRTNQRRLRAEDYVHLRDAMQQDSDTENLGRLIILPSTFTGGPRYMHERTQDAFCYVRKYGRPDFFITFTTNPKWDEITQELFESQAAHDRHDVIARVFHLKLKLMIRLLTKEKVFGSSLCYMYSVEWQKRGLPHAHILLWLEEKIRPNDVDKLISAEFPNRNEDQILHDIIKTHMIHGPCGALNRNSPCMKDGRCSKRYPKVLVEHTLTDQDGYPSYRRRSPDQGGFSATIKSHGHDIVVDNRWVVPYSPVLSKVFKAHINVEMCNSVQSIKYICKYVNKGNDQATFALRQNEHDEVTRFQSGRYISSSEAVWRILSFPIHERFPPVMHLDVHLEGGQRIYFNPDNVTERLENPRQTTLLAFFRLCQNDDFARTLLYQEVPSYYTYNKQQGVFNRRRRGRVVEGFPNIYKEHVIGRVYTVHPNNMECFYMRLLLHTIRGPTSFTDLRTVDDIEYSTFRDACRARHLLDDDQHWDEALADANVSSSPHSMRHLFAILLVFCGLSNPEQLWQKYQDRLAEDFSRNMRQTIDDHLNDRLQNSILNRCLVAIQDLVLSMGGNSLSNYGLPAPTTEGEHVSKEYAAEINYDPLELAETLRSGLHSLTVEQRYVFDRVCHSYNNTMGDILFLDAPGGTGKTFLTKIILAQIRAQGKIALAVASSGVAATLLPGGKTAHTMFKIPIDLETSEHPICGISRNSDKARVLRDCCLIIWDECTMAHRKAVEAVDRTLQDIRQDDRPMGGVTMLFCGDFRQTLPVVPRGTKADELRACLKSSNLWRHITRMHLTENMRARTGGNSNAQEFSDLLLKIGEGTYPEEEGQVVLCADLCHTVDSVEELIASVYGDQRQVTNHENSWFCERSILTPRNDQAAKINLDMLANAEGELVEYTSINRVMEQDDATNYPVEFLDSLNAPGLPSHKIYLKNNVPIILLRNLSPPKLCNGTRLKVTSLQRNIIEAEILTGCGVGETVFIPRIPLIPNNYPFRFKRVQFPVSLCYAMTINKAQGQTLRIAGVDLSFSCFSHGQLYVAFSRVSHSTKLFVHVPNHSTSNVVYKEAL